MLNSELQSGSCRQAEASGASVGHPGGRVASRETSLQHALRQATSTQKKKNFMSIPVIDLFAGPGGLGEGFSRFKGVDFEVCVSIEKDGMAFETLQLRAAHRFLCRSGLATNTVWQHWDSILASEPWNIVFEKLEGSGCPAISSACHAARKEAWNFELGPSNREQVSKGIRQRMVRFMKAGRLPTNSVLIGGPPCQAYSVVGRSRNKGTIGYKAENDQRHFLYREYLEVISEFRPAVFVMENVKGILSSRVAERQIFETIMADLKRPDIACGGDRQLEYVLVALPVGAKGETTPLPDDFIVEAERFGIPQARHRVIVLGIRKDVFDRTRMVRKLSQAKPITVRQVIEDLPELRPPLSYRGKGKSWIASFELPIMQRALLELSSSPETCVRRIARLMEQVVMGLRSKQDPGCGSDRTLMPLGGMKKPSVMAEWYCDRPMKLLANHESRAHMPSDLVRYLFVSAYGHEMGESPRLADFPVSLLPEHSNVDPANLAGAIFKDRFRVQLADRFSMTVTSHIGKDGHAFIHPNPAQSRSLTVREAARLQTFPDSYVFLGTRTSQYTQVGNAVPPYLAVQIAEIVADVLFCSGMAECG
jgi:DNA (cytosine-5)-methyltransferase 1